MESEEIRLLLEADLNDVIIDDELADENALDVYEEFERTLRGTIQHTTENTDTDAELWAALKTSSAAVSQHLNHIAETIGNFEGVQSEDSPGNVDEVGAPAHYEGDLKLHEFNCPHHEITNIAGESVNLEVSQLLQQMIEAIELTVTFTPVTTVPICSEEHERLLPNIPSEPPIILPSMLDDDEDENGDESPGHLTLAPGQVSDTKYDINRIFSSVPEVHSLAAESNIHENSHTLQMDDLMNEEIALRREVEAAATRAEERRIQLAQKMAQIEKEVLACRKNKTATQIQSIWRGCRQRLVYNELLADERKRRADEQERQRRQEHEMAVRDEQRRLQKLNRSAQVIQSHWRGAIARILFKRLRRQKIIQYELELEITQQRKESELMAVEMARSEAAEMYHKEIELDRVKEKFKEQQRISGGEGQEGKEEEEEEYDFYYGSDADTDVDDENENDNDSGSRGNQPAVVTTPTATATATAAAVTIISEKNVVYKIPDESIEMKALRAAESLPRVQALVDSAIERSQNRSLSYMGGNILSCLKEQLLGHHTNTFHQNDGDRKVSCKHVQQRVLNPLVDALHCWQRYHLKHAQPDQNSENSTDDSNNNSQCVHTKQLMGHSDDVTQQHHSVEISVLTDSEIDVLSMLGIYPPSETTSELSLCVESLTDVRFLRAFPALTKIQINVNKLKNLQGIENLIELEDLSAKDNAINDLSALSHLKNLKHLKLDDNHVNASAASSLCGLSKLLTLSLNTNRLTSVPALTGCDRLQRLQLYHNSITTVPSGALKELKNLTHLDLGRNQLEVIDGHALSQCPLLQTLVLSQNSLCVPPAPLYLPHLRTLWLSNNKLVSLKSWLTTDGSSSSLSSEIDGNASVIHEGHTVENYSNWPVFLPSLEKLYLQDNLIEDFDSLVFSTTPILSHLDISFNRIPSVDKLEGLKGLSLLSTLNINDNPVYTVGSTDLDAAESGQRLLDWLRRQCTSLQVVSGNTLGQPSTSSVTRTDVMRTSSNNNTSATSQGQQQQGSTIANASVNASVNTVTNVQEISSQIVSIEDGVNLTGVMNPIIPNHEVLASLIPSHRWASIALRRMSSGGLGSSGSSTASDKFVPIQPPVNTSLEARQLIQAVLTFIKQQNLLQAAEKAESAKQLKKHPRVPGASPMQLDNSSAHARVSGENSWDIVYTNQLRQQINKLLSWGHTNALGPASEQQVVLIDMVSDDFYAGSTDETRTLQCIGMSTEPIFNHHVLSADDRNHRPETGANALEANGISVASNSAATGANASAIEDCDSSATRSSARAGNRLSSNVPNSTAHYPAHALKGVRSLQALHRGRRVRRQIRKILAESRYHDAELDELFGADMDMDIDVDISDFTHGCDAFLNPVQLQSTWKPTKPLESQSMSAIDFKEQEDEDYRQDSVSISQCQMPMPMVYGDHRRRGSFHTSRSASGHEDANESLRAEGAVGPLFSQTFPHPHRKIVEPTEDTDAGAGAGRSAAAKAYPDSRGMYGAAPQNMGNGESRPSTSFTDTSSISTASRAYTVHENDAVNSRMQSRANEANRGANGAIGIAGGGAGSSQISLGPTSPSKSPSKAAAIAEDWGVKDPRVLQAILKRNKRMKSMAHAKEAREKERDPEYRFQRFMKNSFGTTQSNTHTNGASTGGSRTGAGGRGGGGGRGGRGGGKRPLAMPAWALGSQGQEDDDT